MTLRLSLGTVIIAVAFAALGAGVAAGVMAWEPWDGDGDDDRVSSSFCSGAEAWNAGQEPFLIRVDEPRSRESGLNETYDVFYEAAAVVLPVARSGAEESIRAILRDSVRVEETWLSELSTFNDITSPGSSVSVGERVESHRKGEEQRIALNDLLREANSQLGEACGLPPLPIYD